MVRILMYYGNYISSFKSVLIWHLKHVGFSYNYISFDIKYAAKLESHAAVRDQQYK